MNNVDDESVGHVEHLGPVVEPSNPERKGAHTDSPGAQARQSEHGSDSPASQRVEGRRIARRTSRLPDVDDLERLGCKVALTLREASALGLGSERVLRQMVVDGLIKKAVLPLGVGQSRRRYRLLREVLIKELKEARR